ncbi:hypothetical protein [Paenibacillus sp. NPDC057967]|uniref:hypothetical protein n=1 Tax=Paenibacillus sp. NPDC057967 TaxID=3346293 RepID=UPI0036DE876C
MKLKFRDLYEVVKSTRRAVSDMGHNVESVLEGEGKCLISEELNALKNNYASLYNFDILLNESITEIRKKADACFKCLDLI